jgi:hypothetical protein
MPGFTPDSGGIDATAAATEVSGDGVGGTVLALPSSADSSVSSTIASMILEVDATVNFERRIYRQSPVMTDASRALDQMTRLQFSRLQSDFAASWMALMNAVLAAE